MNDSIFDQLEASLAVTKVGIQEFAESDAYCGKPLYPRQLLFLKLMFLEELTGEEEDILSHWIAGGRGGHEIEVSPDIREKVQYLRDGGYQHFREVVLVGGRRSSKGFMTGIAMAKVMYDCLQLQDPGRFYQIDPTKNIMFSCIAGSEQQAQEYQFADFSATVENCKAFQRHVVNSLETEIRVATSADLRIAAQNRARGNKIKKDIARLRGRALASNAGTIRGSATMAVCIDEMAHMLEGISKASADTVYNAIEPSLDQFGIDGMMFLNSSPYTKVGLFHDKYEEGLVPMEEDGNPRILTIRYPSWVPFEGYKGYKTKWNPRGFRKAITVSPDWDEDATDEKGEDLFSKEDKQAIEQARAVEFAKPDVYKVERRAQFAEITDAYLNPAMVEEMFKGRPAGYDKDLRVIHEPMYTNHGEEVRNIYRYKAHLDPSSTTAGFGYAIGHLEEFVMPDGVSVPHVVFDKIKRWNPRDFKGGAIKWSTVMDEIMVDIRLFRPYELTLDQYQSHEPIQTLNMACRDEGLGTRVYEKTATPEVNWRRAENFKTALYQGMVHAMIDHDDHKYAALELKFLQEHKTASKYARIDHPTVGEVKTKDIADCIMEVTSALIGNIINDRLADGLANNMMRMGAPGGYRIGGPTLGDRGRAAPPEIADALSGRKGEQKVAHGSQRPRAGLSIGRRRSRGVR